MKGDSGDGAGEGGAITLSKSLSALHSEAVSSLRPGTNQGHDTPGDMLGSWSWEGLAHHAYCSKSDLRGSVSWLKTKGIMIKK